jgi:hypothetical protein
MTKCQWCNAWAEEDSHLEGCPILETTDKPKGHYESSGYIWDKGEIPQCYQCNEQAKWSTAHSGVHLCDETQCHTDYIVGNCDLITFVEENEPHR